MWKNKIAEKYYYSHQKQESERKKLFYQQNKEKILKRTKEYKLKNKNKVQKQSKKDNAKWRQKYPNYHKQYMRQWIKTKKGKLCDKQKQARRYRDFNFIPMFKNPFNESEQIHWHHINDAYVIAIPKDLHQLYYGKFHRENTMQIVKQIYL